MNLEPITLYYDGACHLCSREIDHYRKRNDRGLFEFEDISRPGFDAEELKIDPDDLNRYFHIRKRSGEWVSGVDAFIEIWKRIPGYDWIAKAATRKWIKPILNLGYHGFARVRPLLPKKKTACAEGDSCRLPQDKAS